MPTPPLPHSPVLRRLALGLVVHCLLACPLHAAAEPIRRLTIEPATILLHGANRQQQLLITAIGPNGSPFDATHLCDITCADPGIARPSGSVLRARRDGTTELCVRLGGVEARARIEVRGSGGYPPIHFGNDVVPIFSKLGCNSAACHGKASGQNGFKLSVFGSDAEADFDALVKEARGRRVTPTSPVHSLLVAKPTGRVPHGGGRRIEQGSRDEALLLEWIKQGMPYGSSSAPRLIGLAASPADRVLSPRGQQQILATAVYSDGSLRDVTAAAGYASNAALVAEADRGGRIHTGANPGEAAVTVHYMGQVAAVRVHIPRPNRPEPYPKVPTNNRIDELALAKWRKAGIVPSPLADDATFLRRLHLDAIGTLPTPAEVRAFLVDPARDKRLRAIDAVLARPEYADYWALQWSDILLVDRDKLGDRGAYEFHHWLRSSSAQSTL